jgi:hypothetical protein
VQSCIYQKSAILKLHLIDSNIGSPKSEPTAVAETSNTQANLSSHGFDAAELEAEITKRLSTLLSEKPDEAAIASELLEVCL